MSFLTQILDGKTEEDVSGRTVVYPWGTFGSGFAVINEAQLAQYRATRRRAVFLSVPAAVAAVVFQSAWVAVGCILVIQIWYGWRIGNMRLDAEEHEAKTRSGG
ncbi:MAG: hypothetical protein AAF441_02830 [Pseudomonadota bacterium]